MPKFALISVSDKTNLVEFVSTLINTHNYTILSTGGTAKTLIKTGLAVTEVSDHTGFPELMDGRIKTLHPKIHGAILANRQNPSHLEQANTHNIPLIDIVAVNLYPFKKTISSPSCTFNDAIENIDIGGPSMLRSAAKNHASVTTICDPSDYPKVLQALQDNSINELRKQLAIKTFQHTSSYDQAITNYLESQQDTPNFDSLSGLPETFSINIKKAKQLRYGENPHQQAALYGNFFDCFKQLQGKDLSFNNILDITSATYLIGEFERPTAAILKHTNPCGVASANTIEDAWELAFKTDTKSPFGGVIVINQTLTEDLAQILASFFCEVIIAPAYSDDALKLLSKKKNLRLMQAQFITDPSNNQELRSVIGGLLIQDRDFKPASGNFQVVSKRQPTPEEWTSMQFGWRVVKHIKSNAIVYTNDEATLGIGAGQMSRIDSSAIAAQKALNAGLSLQGSAVASDAFFPFPDALITAAQSGSTAAIQPGGSINDQDVIDAANEHNMAMVFTNKRHFKH